MRAFAKMLYSLGALVVLLTPFGVSPAESARATNGVLANTDQETLKLFLLGKQAFLRRRTAVDGLGPYFNAESCSSCHHVPRPGGSGAPNNAVLMAAKVTGADFDPLLGQGGPVFQKHMLPGFSPKVIPGYANVRTRRVPPNLLGVGLIDEIPEEAILANARNQPNEDGIRGRPNWVGGRLGRFGYKAQVASIFEFMFQAERDEIGITSPFSSGVVREVSAVADENSVPQPKVNAQEIFHLMYFVKWLAPFSPRYKGNVQSRGETVFKETGCAECHVPHFNTGPKKINAFDNIEARLYSDLLLHDMGDELADKFEQGQAFGRDFRTTPLWGLSRKKYLLHDGRTTSMESAINFHAGEATRVIQKYHHLSDDEKKALLTFLESL